MYLKKRLGSMAQTSGRVEKIQKILKRREDLNSIQNELIAQIQQTAVEHDEIYGAQARGDGKRGNLKNNQTNFYSHSPKTNRTVKFDETMTILAKDQTRQSPSKQTYSSPPKGIDKI